MTYEGPTTFQWGPPTTWRETWAGYRLGWGTSCRVSRPFRTAFGITVMNSTVWLCWASTEVAVRLSTRPDSETPAWVCDPLGDQR